jgi:hypothetical protein
MMGSNRYFLSPLGKGKILKSERKEEICSTTACDYGTA